MKPTAGRILALDDLASRFLSTAADQRASLIDEAKTLVAGLNETMAGYYLKVMQKAGESEAYLATETERLKKLAARKGAVAGKKVRPFSPVAVRPSRRKGLTWELLASHSWTSCR